MIDGVKLTQADIEQKHGANLFQARNTFYDAERKVLDQYVEEYILERAASKENVTVDELIKRHTNEAAGVDPSDDALKVYYEGLDTQEPFATAKDKIRDYIHQRRIAKAKAAYMQSLKSEAKVQVELVAPRAEASLKGVPIRGAKDAPVTLDRVRRFRMPLLPAIRTHADEVREGVRRKAGFRL